MPKYIVHFTGAAQDSKGVCELHTVCVECESHTKIPDAICKQGYTKASGYKWSIAPVVSYVLTDQKKTPPDSAQEASRPSVESINNQRTTGCTHPTTICRCVVNNYQAN